MKIAILADPIDNQIAGVHSYTKGLVDALIRYDNSNEYIVISEKKDPALSNKVRQIAIPNNRFLLLFAALRMLVIIPFMLRRLRVDAVLEPAHFGPFNLPKSIRRITVIHDLTPLLFPQYHRWHSRLLQQLFLPRILKKAHLIIAVSKNTAKDLSQLFPFTPAKTVVIPPGRDPFFQVDHNTAVLEPFQLRAPYFLNVGTIEPRKNLLVLLRAYQNFREQSADKVLLVIVGSKGWKYQSFFAVLDQHPFKEDIRILGYVEKRTLPSLYTHAKAFIYPSLYEGFGLPVLEAMACGASVICSQTSSLPEVGGSVARYFAPEEDAQLLQHLLAIAQGHFPKENDRTSSIQQAASFNWKTAVALFLEVLHK
ncbi:MAG: glycosyltransferase family 1 protein [Bacteroidota bacterium]